MYVVGRPATYAALLLFSLFIINNASSTTSHDTGFPINATPSFDNETVVRLPYGIPWSPKTSTSPTSIPYPIPDTAITLNFINFGFKIPVLRALSTIYDARKMVLSHLASNSEAATKEANFEHSTRSIPPAPRVCSVVLQAIRGLGLSWLQLDQILEGLTQFSSEAGSDRQVHYQALESEVNISEQGGIGIGLLWCTPGRGRGAAEVEKRAETPITSQELDKGVDVVSAPAEETSSTIFNASSSLLSIPTSEISFPVPGTTIILAFIWIGNPIPRQLVDHALDGAFLKVAPFLIKSGHEQIPNNKFLFDSRPTRKVQVVIQIFGEGTVHLSWSLVDIVLAGLYRFMNGIGTRHQETHFNNLDFDIRDVGDGRSIGYGNLLAVPIRNKL